MRIEDNTQSDAGLVAATLAGDREAFGRLYDRHARAVRGIVLGVSGDWSAGDDMSQECFLRAYRRLATLEDPDKFRPWIAGIARQVARERRRQLSRDRHEFGNLGSSVIESATGQRSDALDAEDRDQLEAVMRALGKLSEQERLAVHAFYLQSKDAQQAAELLGLSRSGFYALLKRATARLAGRVQSPAHKENR